MVYARQWHYGTGTGYLDMRDPVHAGVRPYRRRAYILKSVVAPRYGMHRITAAQPLYSQPVVAATQVVVEGWRPVPLTVCVCTSRTDGN